MALLIPNLLMFLFIVSSIGEIVAASTGSLDGRNVDVEDDAKYQLRFHDTVVDGAPSDRRQPPSVPEPRSPTPCCLPDSWQSVVAADVHIDPDDVTLNLEMFVDATKLRMAFRSTMNDTDVYEIELFDAASKTMMLYNVNPTMQTCQKLNFSATFNQVMPRCPPKGSILRGIFNIGGYRPRPSLPSEMWTWNEDTEGGIVERERLVISGVCLPVMEFVRGNIGGKSAFFGIVNYFNVVTPIKNTTIFTPPSYCDNIALGNLEHVGGHYLERLNVFGFISKSAY